MMKIYKILELSASTMAYSAEEEDSLPLQLMKVRVLAESSNY
jgi:hypothetical protein